jgi:hypothetical protein
MLRQTIAGCLGVLLLAGCTTVSPPTASHPSKSLDAQSNDKYECWTEARFLTGHDPEGSSRGARIIGTAIVVGASGYVLARSRSPFLASQLLVFAPAAKPEQHDSALIEEFRKAYVTCLTGRGYSVDGL